MIATTPKKRTSALCVYHGALVLAEFKRHEPTFINALGTESNSSPPRCPQCKKSTEFEEYDEKWLWCASDECDFRIDRNHYFEMLAYFNDPQHDVDKYLDSIKILPL